MAKYKKKRARELQHDRFRDTTMSFLDRLGNRLEGRGRTILYAVGGVILASLLVVFFIKWNNRKNDEARQALGRAITISRANVSTTPIPGSNELTFATDKERAQRAIDEFEKVAAKYGDPYRAQAQFFIASNRLVVDRQKGINELAALQVCRRNSKLSGAQIRFGTICRFRIGDDRDDSRSHECRTSNQVVWGKVYVGDQRRREAETIGPTFVFFLFVLFLLRLSCDSAKFDR